MHEEIVNFIRNLYQTEEFIPLHIPTFIGNEYTYVKETIDASSVSSNGKHVKRFEKEFAQKTGAKHVIATSSGTAALHIALLLANVEEQTEVITQPLTFIATCNAIHYCGAVPHFVDVDRDDLGLSPSKLRARLEQIAEVKNGRCFNKITGNRISTCVPMHTFGHSCKIDQIVAICERFCIPVVEDAAESVGSMYKGKSLGTFGAIGVFSFNGNKIITAGGGGALVTNDDRIAERALYLTTTAKTSHPYEYIHDEVGYNYRMPNLNAALILGQLENLDKLLDSKRSLFQTYSDFFSKIGVDFLRAPENSESNYWLNAVILENKQQRDDFLNFTNANGVMTRAIWKLMSETPMFRDCEKGDLSNAEWLAERVVNIPSSSLI